MSELTPSSQMDAPAQTELPEEHLALVIEDAVAELEAGGLEPRETELRSALLYGWSTGAASSRDLALRSGSDAGLQHLLNGGELWFRDVRAYREEREQDLQVFYAGVFQLLALTGVSRLGRVLLPAPSSPGLPAQGDPSVPYRQLARELLSQAATADLRDDRELGSLARGDELPQVLAEREARRAAFRDAHLNGKLPSPTQRRPTAPRRPPPRDEAELTERIGVVPAGRVSLPSWFRYSEVAGVVATIIIVMAGLVFVRWLSTSVSPSGGGDTRAGVAPPANNPPPAPPVAPRPGPAGSTDPRSLADDMAEARDEAMRLASEALDGDDLQGARDFYFLASRAMPDDEEAGERLREVETALGIDTRRGGWSDALTDLDDLRTFAPGSRAVLQAYVTGLVGAGRDALATRDQERAASLCGEAVRWLPLRDDARSCLLQVGGAPTATPQPSATALPSPTSDTPTPAVVTATPVTLTLTPIRAATPIELTVPTPPVVLAPTEEPAEALQVSLSGNCQAGTIRVSGGVSSASGPVPSYHVDASARTPSGAVFPIANTNYLTPIFQLQRRVDAPGPYVVTVVVDKDGYTSGQSSVRVAC